ncbi:MAG: hypothetical protein HY931_02690 [Candidatus Falkowbacteria bacterium]|nr:MAG: hypothetical protein HY931_02690 [Candidatus Falkowbacteria bacterium]
MKNKMKPSLFSKKQHQALSQKIKVFVLFSVLIFTVALVPIKVARAQMVVTDIPKLIWDKITKISGDLLKKSASLAFQQTLRTALNKMAYDTANWVGSGGQGQKPLFVTQDWGAYMAQIGDEAAGTFLENFANNYSEGSNSTAGCTEDYQSCLSKCASRYDGQTGSTEALNCNAACQKTANSCAAGVKSSGLTVNFCQPSSLESKVKIGLGLANQSRPQGPSCTASQMVKNWSDAAAKYKDVTSPDFLEKTLPSLFDPTSSDLGIYWTASTDMMGEKIEAESVAKTTLLGKGGWLDSLSIGGTSKTLPNAAQLQVESKSAEYAANFGKYTGDAFIDAANVFLNQLAISAFNNLMQNIGKKTAGTAAITGTTNESDPGSGGGEVALKAVTTKLITPNFGNGSQYDILSELATCPDKNNPGPTNCVIDSKLMQGISEKKTVAEAIASGYLHGDWQLTVDSLPGSYESSYSWRNISILREYRILPVSWEAALQKIKNYNIANPDNKTKATLGDLVSCFAPDDEYSAFSSDFDVNNQAWCTGLIDPNWVLKAPLNFCKKEGVSAQILNKNVTPSQAATQYSEYVASQISVVRAENYCADNQSCIKENSSGGCDAFGYCNEEKRTWSFDGDACAPINNTCQAFTNTSSNQKIAYLENTLDYGNCSLENAGCKEYSNTGSYNSASGIITWNPAQNVYLNKNAENCSSKDEGCSEFIRIKPTWGANLVMDSDFSGEAIGASSTNSFLNGWPLAAGGSFQAIIVDSAVEPGTFSGKALKLSSNTGIVSVFSDSSNSLLPSNLDLVAGQSYTLSADVYLATGNNVKLTIGPAGVNQTVYQTSTSGSWQHASVVGKAVNLSQLMFSITASGSGQVVLYVKNIKFEMSDWDTGYSSYGASKTYQKLLPSYLESACYENSADGLSYHLKADAPAKCKNYARKCASEEVGCELFKSVKNNVFSVPAKVSNVDYCPSECVGYDVYVSRQTYFNPPVAENLIPKTAKVCNAEAVGCNEFTNLDDVAAGGEQKEYYSALKQCVKPSQATCASFYSWEGTDNGYQLKLSSLKQDTNNNGPAVTSDDSALCNAAIYNASVNSPLYNADCREFYNAAGQVFYHLNSRVITCSDDCRAYRLTDKNYDPQFPQAQCTGVEKHWDAAAGACAVCTNGGVWNSTHQACVYQGIPGEGKTCSASESGCREYNGNTGNNVRLVSSYDFENTTSSWTSNCTNGISLAAISSSKNGHSLLYNNSASACSAIGSDTHVLAKSSPLIKQIFAGDNLAAQLKVGNGVSQGKSYNVKFLASSAGGADLKIYFYNKNTGAKSSFNNGNTLRVAGGGAWQVYSANLDNLDHEVAATEILAITANGNFYFDNFILTEITDRYYLIKNSSQIPNVCFYDIYDTYQGADYNLGCAAYSDRSSVNHNLRSFSGICDSASVGCEQVISTQNYNPYGVGLWGDDNRNGQCDASELNCTKVKADSAMYVIYDKSKQCNQADLGCSLLGQSQVSGSGKIYSDVFKKNNPNKYDTILCGQEGVGCEEWKDVEDGGLSYFRDPGNKVCVYRNASAGTAATTASQKSWYLAPVKRCDADSNGQIAGTEKNYPSCLSANDCAGKPCIIDNNDYPCEVSYLKTIGLGGEGNRVPVPSKEAALCEIQASTCSEYIDPVSKLNPNLNISNNSVKIKKNTLYVIERKNNSNLPIIFSSPVRTLLANNNYSASTTNLMINATAKAIIFNSFENTAITVSPNSADLREAAIGYQLENALDKGSCNGIEDFSNGCILFNERTISSASSTPAAISYAKLTGAFDPYATLEKHSPEKCDSAISGSCAANQLIKVRPDRVCASWLGCTTYATDPETGAKICYSLQQCNSLNDKGECNNFIASSTPPAFENATGYSSLSAGSLAPNNIGNMKEVGLNSEAHYDFEEIIPPISCVRVGGGPCLFDSIVKNLLVREPEKATVDYPVSGKSYLKVPSVYNVYPMSANSWINLSPNQDYYLNYLVNTKNSSAGAKITIEVKGSLTTTQFTVASPNGWTRKISAFNSGNSGSNNVQVRIRLSSDNTQAGEVYFDDINIEPVLDMGNNQYAARECRLYPTNDSLSCKNQSTNVIKDGLEGYCLEHDKDNPSVCISWYPADRVSSSVLGRQSLGYSGPTSLSYCTNIDANISFAKKITTKLIYNRQLKDGWTLIDGVQSEQCKELATSTVAAYCGDSVNYRGILLDDVEGSDNWNNYYLYCVPRETAKGGTNFLFGVGPETNAQSLKFAGGIAGTTCANIKFFDSAWVKYDGKFVTQTVRECSDSAAGQCEPIDEAKNADPPIRIHDNNYPAFDESGLKYLAAVNGDRSDVFNFTCGSFAQVVAGNGDNKAWTGRTGILADPAYATNTPIFFNDVAAANGLSAYGRLRNGIPFGAAVLPSSYDLLNSGPVYLQNQYYQKDNIKAFGGRPYGCTGAACNNIGYCSENPSVMCVFNPVGVTSSQNCSTSYTDSGVSCNSYYDNCSTSNQVCVGENAHCEDLNNASNYACRGYNFYDCDMDGACTWVVDQPGTCQTETTSCTTVIQTTQTDNDYINRKTCSDGGFGVCRPLWTTAPDSATTKQILSTLFLQSYGAFKYQTGVYLPDDNGGWLPPAGQNGTLPRVENIKLKFNGVDKNMTVSASGVYSLEFNTTVNPEQQPLKMIYINWGDGSKQAITGQDQRSDSNNPHVFYHYYGLNEFKQPYGNLNGQIIVNIWDNWDNKSN